MVPLKYLSNFWRALEMSLIHCRFNLILTWLKMRSLASGAVKNQEPKFTITDTKLYVLFVNLLYQINVKLLKQLESGFT